MENGCIWKSHNREGATTYKEKISEEQRGFRKGRGCVDQIFSFRMVVEKILAKGKQFFFLFTATGAAQGHNKKREKKAR